MDKLKRGENMSYKTRRCIICDRGGAYHFNNLCTYCWQDKIEENIKNFIEQKKKEPF
jgi:hypothetical protein